MSDQQVCYYGCWEGVGHHVFTPRGIIDFSIDGNARNALWQRLWDETVVGDPAKRGKRSLGCDWPADDEHQPQGRARLTFVAGWTLLGFWDRSVDRRFGSCSVFLAEGTFSFDEMTAFAEERFPSVWRRITSAFNVEPFYVENPNTSTGATA